MIRSLLAAMDAAPQRVLWSLCGVCLAMLGFGLYLQISQNLNPCPMCIVQRYALFFVAIVAGLAGASSKNIVRVPFVALLLIGAGFGAFVAARQSWLQWYPPQVASCGRDFYGMIETFPLQRAIPMIFKGSGDCSKVDWTFLGGSIANWSFVCFVMISLLALRLLWRQARRA
jgi:disulfide bond formation protein DsbB